MSQTQLTQDDMKAAIRKLTKRIGEAKRQGIAELMERLRLLRLALMETLAENFDVWTLVNPEGRTEFLDREAWTRRMQAWAERQGGEGQPPGEAA